MVAGGATPASGNYLYLQSDPGDFVGMGGNYLFTPSNYTIISTATGADLRISSGPDGFDGEFAALRTAAPRQPHRGLAVWGNGVFKSRLATTPWLNVLFTLVGH